MYQRKYWLKIQNDLKFYNYDEIIAGSIGGFPVSTTVWSHDNYSSILNQLLSENISKQNGCNLHCF